MAGNLEQLVEKDTGESIRPLPGTRTVLGRARDEVTELDAIMHNQYTRQPEKLRAWQSASRVERAPQREKKTTVTVVSVAPATLQPKAA